MSRRPSPARSLLWAQLRAIRGARAAISRHERQDSPGSWWLQRVLLALGAIAMVGSGVGLGFSLGGSAGTNPARAGVYFLSGPLVVAAYLAFFQSGSARLAHPLGDALLYAPLPRLRSALLRTFDSLVDPANVFLICVTLGPWLGAELAGAHWLNPAGAASLITYAAAIVFAREAFSAVYRYFVELTSGVGTAFIRMAIVLVSVTVPLWIRLIGPRFSGGSFDILALPVLRWMRAPLAPIGLIVAAGAFFAVAVGVRSRPAPKGFSFRIPRLGPTPAASAASDRRTFSGHSAVATMLRMMFVQALRRPTYRYAVAVLAVFSVLALVFQIGNSGFLWFAAFGGPMTGFFNLYGADAPYYALWLATGRTLRDWTLARQLFVLAYYTLFGSIGVAVLVASHTISLNHLPMYLPIFAAIPLAAMLAGPPLSRFVVTPQAREIVRAKVTGRSSRTFFVPIAVGATGVAISGPSLVFIQLGWWPLNYAVLGALFVAVVIARPYRYPWTPAFRERLASAFRS